MDVMNLFTNFEGRIGRQSWWIGTIIMIVASLVLYFILAAVFGIGMMSMDPQKMMEPGFMESYLRKASILQVVMLVILFYPVTALMSKRLNDRDRPSWMKWLFWAPSVLSALIGVAGLGYTTTDMGNGVMMPTPSTLMTLLGFLAMAVGIWALVELGILKGTDGPNQHGPDPLVR